MSRVLPLSPRPKEPHICCASFISAPHYGGMGYRNRTPMCLQARWAQIQTAIEKAEMFGTEQLFEYFLKIGGGFLFVS